EDVDDEANPPDDEERRRAEFAAQAGGIFEPEEDDDEPIFGAEPEEDEDKQERGTRRRRRRRRRSRAEVEANDSDDDLPSYTVSDVPEGIQLDELEAETRERSARNGRNKRDRDRDRELQELDGAVGRGLAEAVASLLATYDKNRGSVSLQNLADAVKRSAEGSELAPSAALLAATVRCDNLRRSKRGERPRFRVTGNRVALEDWALDPELIALEQQLGSVASRYRELSERACLRALSGLPHKSFGELVILLLEELGVKQLAQVRRPGSHGAELHLKGVVQHAGSELRTAIVVRRDGREVGRERVTELRGALHHYGPAVQGYLITAGQVLSGAREEARAPGAAPVTLMDGHRLAELCLEHGVCVQEHTLTLT